MKRKDDHKTYLGDSVYASVSDFGDVKICTNNGDEDENEIYLEPQVLGELLKFIDQYISLKHME